MARASEIYAHILPELEAWPIYKLSQNRKTFINEINEFTFNRLKQKYQGDLTDLLTRTIYLERIRMREVPWRVDPPNEKNFWRKIKSQITNVAKEKNLTAVHETHDLVLRRIINRYSEEIVGSFVPKTYLFARKFLTAFFKRLLSKRSKKTVAWGNKEQLFSRLKVYGPLDLIRSLAKRGTLILVPTHFSNLDSILIGYAIDAKVGLPSFSYGAGLNLYNFGPAAYFMNRLGAYRVDRRKKNPVYLETLKSMSNLSIQHGTHTLFFPGGTRSRSGRFETNLKLGLLGTVVEAQRSICEQGSSNKLFIVPLILDYHFVLEARYLIEQYLRDIGKEKYLAIRDQSKSKRKLLKFIWQFYNKGSEIVLSFGRPFDVMGNFVDEAGNSFDDKGRLVSIDDYFKLNDQIHTNLQRESIYTRLLADRIVERFKKDNVVLTSHIVAFIAFQYLLKENSELDLYGVLQLPPEDFEIPYHLFKKYFERIRDKLLSMEKEGEVRVSEPVMWNVHNAILDGIDNLGIYHAKKPLKITSSQHFVSENFVLLYYYHNRLANYHLESMIQKRIPASPVIIPYQED